MRTNNALALAFRAVLGIGVGLLGVVHPIFFVIGLFFLWTVFMDLGKPKVQEHERTDAPPRGDIDFGACPIESATADTPDWKTLFVAVCESPAEVAFLEAAVHDMGLLPDKGALRGGDFCLTMQQDFKVYRVDFMLNDCLIIEVDGAAYHSSPEAQANDKERDAYFASLGYTTLRLPAKDVFRSPVDVMARVRSALPAAVASQRSRTAALVAAAESSKRVGVFEGIRAANELLDQAARRMAREMREREELIEKNGPTAMARLRAEQTAELLMECDLEFRQEMDRRIEARRETDRQAGRPEPGAPGTSSLDWSGFPDPFGIHDPTDAIHERRQEYIRVEGVKLLAEMGGARPRWREIERIFDEETPEEVKSSINRTIRPLYMQRM